MANTRAQIPMYSQSNSDNNSVLLFVSALVVCQKKQKDDFFQSSCGLAMKRDSGIQPANPYALSLNDEERYRLQKDIEQGNINARALKLAS